MLTVGQLKAILDNIEDEVEITIGASNGMVEVKSVEYNLEDNESIVLKTNLDNLIGLCETLNKNNGVL